LGPESGNKLLQKIRVARVAYQPRDIAGFRTFAASTAAVLNSGFLLSWEDVLAPLAPVTAVIF